MSEDNKVPYIIFEGEMARHERTVRRLIAVVVVTLALLFASNMCWLWFFNQFDFSTETISQGTESGRDRSQLKTDGRYESELRTSVAAGILLL